jgi:hypothetical protein
MKRVKMQSTVSDSDTVLKGTGAGKKTKINPDAMC